MALFGRVKQAWNAFRYNEDNVNQYDPKHGSASSSRPDKVRRRFYNDRSLVSAIYNRIAIDVASIDIRHVELDDQGRYLKDHDSALNECLTLEANIDQAPREWRQDIAMTLFDHGVAVLVPVDTGKNPFTTENFDIYTLRVGEVVTWYPKHVKVRVYNENLGVRQDITLEKRFVAIVPNPLYAVMNEPNSTLQRLIRKLQLLDVVDEQSGSGKLDIIIQLPYSIKTDTKREQAEKRREDIEFQLRGSKYGIAYTDGTEKITQLNRPTENNLFKQVEYLINLLYDQLGINEEIMNGTADEKAMLNYYNRTIEPIVASIVENMQRAFLADAGVHKVQRIKYFRDPFKLVPVNDLAEIADKFTRNEILTANEIRGFMGISPSKDKKADELRNSNMPEAKQEQQSSGTRSFGKDSQNES